MELKMKLKGCTTDEINYTVDTQEIKVGLQSIVKVELGIISTIYMIKLHIKLSV